MRGTLHQTPTYHLRYLTQVIRFDENRVGPRADHGGDPTG